MTGHHLRWKSLLLGLLLTAGCGSDTQNLNEKVSVENASPKGSIGGVIYDAVTQAPIPPETAVRVTVISGAETTSATANQQGLFSIADVPASGSIQVLIGAEGYLSAHMTADFVNEAGQFPVDNAVVSLGPIGLVPNSGTVTLHLFDDQGNPVSGAPLVMTTELRWLLWDNGQPTAMGSETLTASTDSSGTVVFEGLPDYWSLGSLVDDTLTLTVPPLDYDQDGIYDYPGGDFVLSALRTNGPDQSIVLSNGYPTTLTILSSNVPALKAGTALYVPSVLAPDDTIRVVFSAPIDEDTLLVRVMDEDMQTTLETSTTVSGRTLEIAFASELPVGSKFHLQIHVTSSVSSHPVSGNFYAPLYTASADPPTVTSIEVDPDSDPNMMHRPILIHFNQPVGPGNPNKTNYTGAFCAVWFNFDTNSSATIGDVPPEVGSSSCNVAGLALQSNEKLVDIPGAYQSGFSSHWRMVFPQDGTFVVQGHGRFQLIFSGVNDNTRIFSTPAGGIVPDQLDLQFP